MAEQAGQIGTVGDETAVIDVVTVRVSSDNATAFDDGVFCDIAPLAD